MSYHRKKQLFLRFGKAVGKEGWVHRTRLCAYFKAKETKYHTHTHHTHTHTSQNNLPRYILLLPNFYHEEAET